MLILSRKIGQSIYIGDDIKIKVLDVNGKQIKLGLTVPDEIAVYREEIYAKIANENTLAQETSNQDLNAVAKLWQTS